MTDRIFLYQEAQFLLSAPQCRHLPDDYGKEIVFAGRSNAGKSSVINILTRKGLARTSKTPGRTQAFTVFTLPYHQRCAHDANALPPPHRLIDLPGYGFAAVPPKLQQRWSREWLHYLHIRESLSGIVLIMDIRHPFQPTDQQFLETCLIQTVPIHILLTKADKLSRHQATQALQKTKQHLHALCKNQKNRSALLTLQTFSSLTRQGREALQTQLDSWWYASPGL